MDWIDELLDKLRLKINNLSMKKTLIVYILFCIVVVAALSAITQSVCEQWKDLIWSQYTENGLNSINTSVAYYDLRSAFTGFDRVLDNIIDFVQTWSTILYSIIGIIGTSYLFYNNKIKIPIQLLKEATDKVGNNDLNLELEYDRKDELGDLCQSFDLMRRQLLSNNQKMWDMMEEQRRLNAAFAHDLRTPLTVLRGYADLLSQYIPEGKISEDKLISTLKIMSEHIRRLENYSNTMKEISCLEELPLKRIPMDGMAVEKKLREITDALDGKDGIHIKLFNAVFDGKVTFHLDELILMEVFENLMSNALRYARSEIEVVLSLSEDEKHLLLSVADDGKGFSEMELNLAIRPYYTDHKEQNTEHFGIGLYICKLLSEKHSGRITVDNRMNGGAVITAEFLVSGK